MDHRNYSKERQRSGMASGWPALVLFLMVSISSSSHAIAITSGSAGCPSWLGLSSGSIQDWQLAASSHWTGSPEDPSGCQARHARLYHSKAWCAKHRMPGEWILVDLGVLSHVTGILTQGREDGPDSPGEWVTAFSLSYSLDAFKWNFVEGSGGRKVFRGNTDPTTVRHVQLDQPILARFVRLHVVEWKGRPSLRMEIVGCQECNQVVTESAHVRLTASSSPTAARKQHACQPDSARLFSHTGWCAKKQDAEQWIQYDLGPPREITGIITRGHGGGSWDPSSSGGGGSNKIPMRSASWITSYTLSYSNDSLLWFTYRDGNHLDAKVFGGNGDRDTERRHYLNHPFSARYVRLHPLAWHHSIGLRSALIGCPAWRPGQQGAPEDYCGPGFFSLNPLSGCQENLAYHRTTWLNDKRHLWKDWKYGRASLAVDGDTDGSLHRCAILDNYFVDQPIWMVDLGRKHSINGVLIVPWLGKGQDKTASYRDYQAGLERLTVYVSTKPRLEASELLSEPTCGTVGRNETGSSNNLFQPRIHVPCWEDLRGRYVYIRASPVAQRKARLFFSVLCEVIVY